MKGEVREEEGDEAAERAVEEGKVTMLSEMARHARYG